MKSRAFILLLMVVSLGHVSPAAYAGRVPVPAIPLLEDKPALTIAEYEAFAAMAKYAADEVAIPRLSITGKITTPRVGSTTSYGVTVTADLAAAFDAYMRGDGPAALAALDAAEAAAGDNARSLFEISMLRAQIHIMTGRSDAAVAETARAETYEIQTFKTNVNSRALRGEARLWAGDFEFAINDLAQVAVATREWRLPTSYNSQPTNMGEMFNMTTVQLRAYGALAATYVLLEDFAAALPWASRAEVAADVFTVATHPMYGSFVPFHADSYYGRALNLAVLGAARLIVNGDRNAAEMAVASAHELLDAAGFVTPKITVDMLYAQALFETGFQDAAEIIAGAAGLDAARPGLPDMVGASRPCAARRCMRITATRRPRSPSAAPRRRSSWCPAPWRPTRPSAGSASIRKGSPTGWLNSAWPGVTSRRCFAISSGPAPAPSSICLPGVWWPRAVRLN